MGRWEQAADWHHLCGNCQRLAWATTFFPREAGTSLSFCIPANTTDMASARTKVFEWISGTVVRLRGNLVRTAQAAVTRVAQRQEDAAAWAQQQQQQQAEAAVRAQQQLSHAGFIPLDPQSARELAAGGLLHQGSQPAVTPVLLLDLAPAAVPAAASGVPPAAGVSLSIAAVPSLACTMAVPLLPFPPASSTFDVSVPMPMTGATTGSIGGQPGC